MWTGRNFIFTIIILNFLSAGKISGQSSDFHMKIDSLSAIIPALNRTVDISLSNVSMQEFLRSVANASGLNLNVDPSVNQTVSNNFKDVKVGDMLLFLELNYPVDIFTVGNIVNVSRRQVPHVIEKIPGSVIYDSLSQSITLDFHEVDISRATREITMATAKNIVLSPSLSSRKISSYVEKLSFRDAMEQLTFSNDLELRVTDGGIYVFQPIKQEATLQAAASQVTVPSRGNVNSKTPTLDEKFELEVKKTTPGKFSITCHNAPLLEVVRMASEQSGSMFYLGTGLTGTLTMSNPELDFESLLKFILPGTPYAFRKEKNMYIIGGEAQVDLKDFKVYQFRNRTTGDILEIIPDDLKTGLILKEYKELNSILISGMLNRIEGLTAFLQEIDKTVPVVLIEVMIVDVNKNFTISTGIDAGLGDAPTNTKGQVFPKIDLQIGADELNKILGKSGSFGVINLGNLNPNFYLSLKALEEQGILKVNSTPQLSTLNGHEATLAIGKTEYYLEEQSNFIGTQNPQLSTSQTYKPVNAELSILIRPIVSGDDQITLEIEVGQSDFTERISNTAPPGSVTRDFKSIIRIKNQETIILGGLEQKKIQDSASGVPLISRIPLLKWLFSSRTRVNSDSKLTIFIKPTIIG